MSIRAEELYLAAQNLNRMRPPLVSDEVCGRTMLNRMYYAAYLATREAIRVQLGNPTFDVTHAALANTLMQSADPDVQALGSRLHVLKTVREIADYHPHVGITKSSAALRLVDARFVLDSVSRLAARFPLIRARYKS